MAGRIPQTFIDDLLSRTDIVDIIENYVSLRKGGKNYLGLCPFHNEKTPSFTVSPDKQFYHCFGCGANGTAITFLMDFNRMEFPEVVEELASRAGLEIPREGIKVAGGDGHAELYELMELIVKFYRAQLKEHPDSGRAVEYLKTRGITGEIAADFELGYAPPGWDNLINKFGTSQEAKTRLEKLGMIIRRNSGSGYYDRFRDRIIYPIRDYRGRVTGFGGRTLGDDTPKYLNSPETPIFHKGRELYGLNRARQALDDAKRIFVVEGYMDAIALVQNDIPNVVATLGVAATRDHLNRLYRYANQVVFCFDGDEAGRSAAWRAMETALPFMHEGKQAYFMFMPEGIDPDDMVRKEGKDFFTDGKNVTALSDYLLETLKAKTDLSTREGKSNLIDLAKPYIALLPRGALRQLITEDLARLAGTRPDNLDALIPAPSAQNRKGSGYKPASGSRTAVTTIIELILSRPELARLVETPEDLAEIPDPGAGFLKQLVELIHARPGLNCAGIIENWRGTRYESRLRELAANSDERVAALADPEVEMIGALALLDRQRAREYRQKISNKPFSELSNEEKAHLRQAGKGRPNSPKK